MLQEHFTKITATAHRQCMTLKVVFKFQRNYALTNDSRAFQARAAATKKARSLTVEHQTYTDRPTCTPT